MVCSCNNSKEIPTINIDEAFTNKKELRLSELAKDIEYVKLENTPMSRIFPNVHGKTLVGDNVILYKSSKSAQVLVFDRKGKFLNPIAVVGKEPEDFDRLSSIIDLSPDEKKVLVLEAPYQTREGLLKIYSIDGSFLKSRKMPTKQYDGIFFLSNERILAVRNLQRLPHDAFKGMVYDMDLNPIDSILNFNSADLEIASSGYYNCLLNNSNTALYLRKPADDTIFSLDKQNELVPSLIVELGKYKAPIRKLNEEELSKYLFINSVEKVGNYYLLNSVGNTVGYDPDKNPYDEDIIALNQKTKECFYLQRYLGATGFEGGDSLPLAGILNDVDPMGNLGTYGFSNIRNNRISDLFTIYEIKNQLKNKPKIKERLKTNKYFDELLNLSNSSSIDDNPVVRIIRCDKSKSIDRKYFKSLAGKDHKLESGNMINLMDGWELTAPGPKGSSGLTIDPTDGTIWIMDFFDDTVFHFTQDGVNLNDGFAVDSTAGEGITYDPTDDTFWIIDGYEYKYDVEHFNKSGINLNDGFPVFNHGIRGAGIAYDSQDNTMWIIDPLGLFIYHFDKLGNLIDDGFSIKQYGANQTPGICYDPRDNTLWVVNHPAHVFHFNKKGELLEDSFRLGEIAPTIIDAEGIAFDPLSETFWINGLRDARMHHIGYK